MSNEESHNEKIKEAKEGMFPMKTGNAFQSIIQ